MPTHRRRAAAACALVLATTPVVAAPASGQERAVTWEQVRTSLAVARRAGTPERGATAEGASGTVAMTVPDLSAALDDVSAAPATRRAACHQVTGLDDESSPPLAACLAHVGARSRG